jgi:hypothetical protein
MAEYWKPVVGLLALYLSLYLLVVIIFVARRAAQLLQKKGVIRRQSSTALMPGAAARAQQRGTTPFLANHRVKWDDASYTKVDKFFFRSKEQLMVADMARKLPSLMERKSLRYLW